jgi:cell wall-associated NlpC family hydrolase
VLVATVLALGVPAVTASADPVVPGAQPATAADAKTLWLQSSEQAEALNEQVLQADDAVTAAAAALTAADTAVTDAATAVTAAQQAQSDAQVVVDSYSGKLASFANASFRGARLGQLSSLLTSDSADDYLDSVTALDHVAGDTAQLLSDARSAKEAADAATADVTAKQAAAQAAQAQAVVANDTAVAAQASLISNKAALDAQVTQYQDLYEQLSEQEREAALAAEAAQRAAEAAAAAAADPTAAAPAVDNAAAGAPAATSSSSSSSSSAAAAVSVDAPNSAAAAAVAAALSKVGSRYVFGAAGPNSFDCSGLTSWAWAQAGISIPRTSSGQAGLPSVPLSQLQPGDLVTYYSPVHHVAMYIGGGQIVHASTSSKPVLITSVNYGGPNATGHRVG